MSNTIVKEEMFPEIVETYNKEGKKAAYGLIRDRYGLKNPYFVISRIKSMSSYEYDPVSDCFLERKPETDESIFMDLDELCMPSVKAKETMPGMIPDERAEALEKLVHELISDRLLILSRYITVDSSNRTIMIDQTSLSADGYRVVTH